MTCFFLPVAASVMLGRQIVAIAFYYHRSAMALSVCIVMSSALLGVVTLLQLRRLNRQSFTNTGEDLHQALSMSISSDHPASVILEDCAREDDSPPVGSVSQGSE